MSKTIFLQTYGWRMVSVLRDCYNVVEWQVRCQAPGRMPAHPAFRGHLDGDRFRDRHF